MALRGYDMIAEVERRLTLVFRTLINFRTRSCRKNLVVQTLTNNPPSFPLLPLEPWQRGASRRHALEMTTHQAAEILAPDGKVAVTVTTTILTAMGMVHLQDLLLAAVRVAATSTSSQPRACDPDSAMTHVQANPHLALSLDGLQSEILGKAIATALLCETIRQGRPIMERNERYLVRFKPGVPVTVN